MEAVDLVEDVAAVDAEGATGGDVEGGTLLGEGARADGVLELDGGDDLSGVSEETNDNAMRFR